jgi:hypothetical protein
VVAAAACQWQESPPVEHPAGNEASVDVLLSARQQQHLMQHATRPMDWPDLHQSSV